MIKIPKPHIFFNETIDMIYQFNYPEEFNSVLRGDGYWLDPINILGHYNKFCELWSYKVLDMNRPRCYYCGKYVKKGNWWKGRYTGPCRDCDEDAYFGNY